MAGLVRTQEALIISLKRLPPNARFRMVLAFYCAKILWRCRQSKANQSLLIFPANRENTGKYRDFIDNLVKLPVIADAITVTYADFPKIINREAFIPIRECNYLNREACDENGVWAVNSNILWRTRHTNGFVSKMRSKSGENSQLSERLHSLSSVFMQAIAGIRAPTRQSPKSSRNLSI